MIDSADAMRSAAVVGLPGLHESRNTQVRNRESNQARFRLAADTGCALVANLAAGACRSARKRRDGSRVVVGFDLHQDVRGFGARAMAPSSRG
jgi:hypothetical protein